MMTNEERALAYRAVNQLERIAAALERRHVPAPPALVAFLRDVKADAERIEGLKPGSVKPGETERIGAWIAALEGGDNDNA